ncbi:hypothetical protein D3C77_15580 [compost metagenome]
MWMPWRRSCLSEVDQQITDSIKALKTLEIHDGRVSISPSEVLGQPGYLEARRRAANLVTHRQKHQRFETWADVDLVGMEAYMDYIRSGLLQLRAEGISPEQALQRVADGFGA